MIVQTAFLKSGSQEQDGLRKFAKDEDVNHNRCYPYDFWYCSELIQSLVSHLIYLGNLRKINNIL